MLTDAERSSMSPFGNEVEYLTGRLRSVGLKVSTHTGQESWGSLGSLCTAGSDEDLKVTLVCKVVNLSIQNQDVGLEKQLGFFQARIAKEKDKVENIDKKKSDMMDPEIYVLKVGVYYVLRTEST